MKPPEDHNIHSAEDITNFIKELESQRHAIKGGDITPKVPAKQDNKSPKTEPGLPPLKCQLSDDDTYSKDLEDTDMQDTKEESNNKINNCIN